MYPLEAAAGLATAARGGIAGVEGSEAALVSEVGNGEVGERARGVRLPPLLPSSSRMYTESPGWPA